MKKVIIIPMVVAFLHFGCTEVVPLINTGPGVQSKDTTYVTNAEKPQSRNVLIEEFTGVSCPPCPAGHEMVKNIKAQYPERIVVIAYHILNFPQAKPVSGVSKSDFRTQDATDIGSFFGGMGFMPAAIIDRTARAGNYVLGRNEWNLGVNDRAKASAQINMYLTSGFDEAKRVASVKLKIAYTERFTQQHMLTLAVIESDIIDAQITPTEVDTFYTHNYVLRDIVTPISGATVLDSIASKEPGRVVEQVFEVTLKDEWDAANCKVVAFVHSADPNKREVYQAVEAKIK